MRSSSGGQQTDIDREEKAQRSHAAATPAFSIWEYGAAVFTPRHNDATPLAEIRTTMSAFNDGCFRCRLVCLMPMVRESRVCSRYVAMSLGQARVFAMPPKFTNAYSFPFLEARPALSAPLKSLPFDEKVPKSLLSVPPSSKFIIFEGQQHAVASWRPPPSHASCQEGRASQEQVTKMFIEALEAALRQCCLPLLTVHAFCLSQMRIRSLEWRSQPQPRPPGGRCPRWGRQAEPHCSGEGEFLGGHSVCSHSWEKGREGCLPCLGNASPSQKEKGRVGFLESLSEWALISTHTTKWINRERMNDHH